MRRFPSTTRMRRVPVCCWFLFLLFSASGTWATTDPGDVAILREFEKGLKNPSLLKWPPGSDDPCGPPRWPNVFCSGSRVSQIQVQNFGLEGPLPANLNSLTELQNLGLQRNKFSGPLPSFSGLSNLQYAYLGSNRFDSIPADFFDGLTSVQVLSLEHNPLNASSGWSLPNTIASDAPQLQKLFLTNSCLSGSVPDVLGSLPSLSILELAYNTLTGAFPASFNGSQLRSVILNNQLGDGLSGALDVFATMTSLEQLWLHGNQFSGVIPAAFANCVSLKDLKLNGNKLVGPIPPSLGSIPSLRQLAVDNNLLSGPIPVLKIANFTYGGNSFCVASPGAACADQVTALLGFLDWVNYPTSLAGEWTGNDPCAGWLGVSCDADEKVSVLNLPRRNLNGGINPSLANLSSLVDIQLQGNNLVGPIPPELTGLKLLRTIDVSSNNLQPPIPSFTEGVKLLTDGNPCLHTSISPTVSPPPFSTEAPSSPSGGSSTPSPTTPSWKPRRNGTNSTVSELGQSNKIVGIVVPVAVVASLLACAVSFAIFCVMKRKKRQPPSAVVHPRDHSDPDSVVRIVVANDSEAKMSAMGSNASQGRNVEAHSIESGNLLSSVQVLRSVTRDFASQNEIGRGGFGVVYKGELDDGTMIAVKRMEASVISNKALDEFQSEIAVLSKVRHRHLVSLMGYCVEGNERLLVYEYMPQGALSKHIFHWKELNLQPLTWKQRLNVALDVARGMEYLHSLAHQSFIHRDLKSSNILLGDDFRAKVSDFGLVKLAPEGKGSVVTRLAGTFGYLAPEYAVTGKITTKVDVFSFGVVLVELLTGLMAVDEDRSEESRYLVQWFWKIKSSQESLLSIIDPALDVTEDTSKSISTVAELAWHCTVREPNQRPDMSHAVNVLSPLVQKWKPDNKDEDDLGGIAYNIPLHQLVKVWQASGGESAENSLTASDDSKGSIPMGFAESFTSSDGR